MAGLIARLFKPHLEPDPQPKSESVEIARLDLTNDYMWVTAEQANRVREAIANRESGDTMVLVTKYVPVPRIVKKNCNQYGELYWRSRGSFDVVVAHVVSISSSKNVEVESL